MMFHWEEYPCSMHTTPMINIGLIYQESLCVKDVMASLTQTPPFLVLAFVSIDETKTRMANPGPLSIRQCISS